MIGVMGVALMDIENECAEIEAREFNQENDCDRFNFLERQYDMINAKQRELRKSIGLKTKK